MCRALNSQRLPDQAGRAMLSAQSMTTRHGTAMAPGHHQSTRPQRTRKNRRQASDRLVTICARFGGGTAHGPAASCRLPVPAAASSQQRSVRHTHTHTQTHARTNTHTNHTYTRFSAARARPCTCAPWSCNRVRRCCAASFLQKGGLGLGGVALNKQPAMCRVARGHYLRPP